MWLQSLVQENWWLGTRERKGKAKKGKNALTSVTGLVYMVQSLTRDARFVNGERLGQWRPTYG